MSLSQAYLDSSSDFAKGCIFSTVAPRMKRVIADVLRVSLPSFLPPVEQNIRCFQLFSADFLVRNSPPLQAVPSGEG